jgi:hypothetical protein
MRRKSRTLPLQERPHFHLHNNLCRIRHRK